MADPQELFGYKASDVKASWLADGELRSEVATGLRKAADRIERGEVANSTLAPCPTCKEWEADRDHEFAQRQAAVAECARLREHISFLEADAKAYESYIRENCK